MEISPYQRFQQIGLTEPIHLPSPKTRMRWITAGCAVFAVIGLLIFFHAEDLWEQAVALLCIVLTGIVGGVVMPPLLKKGDIAVLDREGLYTRRYNVKIFWTDIQAAAVMKSGEYESLCVLVKNYEKYRLRIPWQAAWMRAFYRSVWGRFSTITLMQVLDPVTGKELMGTLSEAGDFDFFWSHHEFPGMSVQEVKDIIEIQSQSSQKGFEESRAEGIEMTNEKNEPKVMDSDIRTARPVSPEKATGTKVLCTIPGFIKHAESAGDGGGGMWYEKAVVELLEDRLRVIEPKESLPDKINVILLDDIAEMKMQPCPKAGEYGSLKFKFKKKSFWDYLLKLFPLEVNFDLSQQDQFVQLTERINQMKTKRGEASPISYKAQKYSSPASEPIRPAKAGVPSLDDLDALVKLADLRDKGILSEEEFNAKKKQILGL